MHRLKQEEYRKLSDLNTLIAIHEINGESFSLENIKVEITDNKIMVKVDSNIIEVEPTNIIEEVRHVIKMNVVSQLLDDLELLTKEVK